MQIHRLTRAIALSSPLLLGVCSAFAQDAVKSTETTTTTVITTAVPAPKEPVVAPAGYTSCTTVAAGWQDKTWHPEYKVCRYDVATATVQGEAWVGGHWQCSQYTVSGGSSECTAWEWAQGHWVKTFSEAQ